MDENWVRTTAKSLLKEEINSLYLLEEKIDSSFTQAVESILKLEGHLAVCGLGKSGLIGQKISSTLASTGTPSFFLHASEALHGDLGMIHTSNGVLAMSHSGETPEILAVVQFLKDRGILSIGMTRSRASSLGRLADICLEIPVAKEICPHNLTPTCSTLAHLLMGDILAMILLKSRKFTSMEFAALHPAGSLGRRLLPVSTLSHSLDETPVVTMGTSVEDSLAVLTEKGFGTVIVMDDSGFLKGILCDGDVRRLYTTKKYDGSAPIETLMTANPKKIQEGVSAVDALNLMQFERKITVLPVVSSDGRVKGILHMHDLVRAGLV